MDPITIVGVGMAGAACAVALREADVDVDVRLVDRGRAPGGRMASPELHGRRVDLGAAYFTVGDTAFADVVARWEAAGLARPWTDTFAVRGGADTTGPVRWAAPGGLRSLVRDLLEPFEVEVEEVREPPPGCVVLAMPDPHAAALVEVPDAVAFDPVIAVACGFDERTWDFATGQFVNDHPDLSFVADDGTRRGDGAPVLVAHTTPSAPAPTSTTRTAPSRPSSPRLTRASRSGPTPTAGRSPSRPTSTPSPSESATVSSSPATSGAPTARRASRAPGSLAPASPPRSPDHRTSVATPWAGGRPTFGGSGRPSEVPRTVRTRMRLVVARCSVTYSGRLDAHLPEAVRLLMLKADGSVLVHCDGGGYKPLNCVTVPT